MMLSTAKTVTLSSHVTVSNDTGNPNFPNVVLYCNVTSKLSNEVCIHHHIKSQALHLTSLTVIITFSVAGESTYSECPVLTTSIYQSIKLPTYLTPDEACKIPENIF